jgi:hypothetical protein
VAADCGGDLTLLLTKYTSLLAIHDPVICSCDGKARSPLNYFYLLCHGGEGGPSMGL